jgi:hypothetical protein
MVERRPIATPLPPRSRFVTPAAMTMRHPVVLRDVTAGTNCLEVKSSGDQVSKET